MYHNGTFGGINISILFISGRTGVRSKAFLLPCYFPAQITLENWVCLFPSVSLREQAKHPSFSSFHHSFFFPESPLQIGAVIQESPRLCRPSICPHQAPTSPAFLLLDLAGDMLPSTSRLALANLFTLRQCPRDKETELLEWDSQALTHCPAETCVVDPNTLGPGQANVQIPDTPTSHDTITLQESRFLGG